MNISFRSACASPSIPLVSALALLVAACGIDTKADRNERKASGAGAGGVDARGNGSELGSGGLSLTDPPANADGSVLSEDDACVSESVVGEHVPLDLYMVIDKSGSMRCLPEQANCDVWASNATSRWGLLTSALKSFINAPENAGLGVGLGFFPVGGEKVHCIAACEVNNPTCECLSKCGCASQFCSCDTPNRCLCTEFVSDRDLCDSSWYDLPAAPISLLPDKAPLLVEKIDAQILGGGTPTAGALTGGLAYARAWAEQHVARRAALVFATDGEPADCGGNNTLEDAANAAKAAFSATPSVATYVIGVGNSLSNLNKIAEAGGTEQAYLVEASATLEKFKLALSSIRGRALSCSYQLPSKDDLDYGKVNIKVTIGGTNTSNLIKQAEIAAACGSDDGWFYDNATAPTQISLCKKTCDEMSAAAGSKIDLLMGCITERLDPR